MAVGQWNGPALESTARWYARNGEWLRRAVFGVATFVLAHALLSLWPAYSPEVILFWSLLVAIAGVWLPAVALLGFFILFTPSLLYASAGLAIAFGILWLIAMMIPGLADTPLKLTLVLAAPLAFEHGWFFFPALVAALVYTNASILQAAVGSVFALLVAWLQGWHISGVFPPQAPRMAVAPHGAPFFSWIAQRLSHPSWNHLAHLGQALSPYAISAVAVIVIELLVTRLAAFLRHRRSLKDDALAVLIPTLGGVVVWAMAADGLHPSTAVAFAMLPSSLLAGAAAWVLGRAVPAKTSGATGEEQRDPRLRKAGWEDIAGYDDLKEELRDAVQPYTDQAMRRDLQRQGLPIVRGILLYGPPGTGKTLIARVLATELRMHFISVSGPEFLSKWVGESEKRLREIFQQARDQAPSMIFFDEVESFLTPRDQVSAETGGGQVSRNVVATFLAEMDGLMERGDVLVVAATNYPDQIDDAAIRAGRFDKILFVPPPDANARSAIFRSALEGRSGSEALAADRLVERTERYTAADIIGTLTNAYRAAAQRRSTVTQDELEALFHQTKPTVSFAMLERYEKLQDRYGRRSQVTERTEVVTHARLGWESIAGMDTVKTALREAVELPLKYPDRFKEWGVTPHKGILLYGPPGCGKTLFAKVVSDTADARFYTVNGPELLGGGPGAAEQRLRQLFERARENRPAVIFFDEIDAIAGRRDSLSAALQGPIVQQMLTLMDGKEALNGVVVVAATNRPDQLDTALLRPGRFDRLIYVPLPDEASRAAQWQLHLLGKPGAEGVDFAELAAASEGYTGAEIRHAVKGRPGKAQGIADGRRRGAAAYGGPAPRPAGDARPSPHGGDRGVRRDRGGAQPLKARKRRRPGAPRTRIGREQADAARPLARLRRGSGRAC